MTENTHSMLQFDWDDVHGRVVTGIVGESLDEGDDGVVTCDCVALIIGYQAVIITLNHDTDEMYVNLSAAPDQNDDWSSIDALAGQIGKQLSWCWECRNYRGYLDAFSVGFSVGFDRIEPDCMFFGMGSSIFINNVIPIGLASSTK